MNNLENLLKNLDNEQRQAVESEIKDTVVLANAGSGKTRVLTHRVAYYLQKGLSGILLLTFTNKASEEMLSRVKQLVDVDINNKVLGGTFHSVAVKFLKRYSTLLGFENNFGILSTDDSYCLIQRLLGEFLQDKSKEFIENFPNKKVIFSIYSTAFNKKLSIIDYINMVGYDYTPEIIDDIKNILIKYMQEKRRMNLMDFDDLLKFFYLLIKNKPKIRQSISEQYPYILVDEYQDINWIQHDIIELLNESTHNLFVVGDQNQCIYGFRGSESSYIENFNKIHQNSNYFYITRNYRSQKHILSLAEESINNNPNLIKTKITSVLKELDKPFIYKQEDNIKQANYIAKEIKKLNKQKIPYKEICILVRNNFTTRELETSFSRNKIPYKILSGLSFFERQHIKDIISLFKYLDNPYDEISFIRFTSLFNGIGSVKIHQMLLQIRNIGNIFNLDTEKLNALFKFKGSSNESLNLIKTIVDEINNVDAIEDKIKIFYNLFYENYMKQKFEDFESRKEDVESLLESAAIYKDLNKFLTEVILDTSSDKDNCDDYVTITTVHKAKGLEWDVVFITTLNKGNFPSYYAKTDKEIQEERNLFYVAITRARKRLYASYVLYNRRGKQDKSIFLDELKRDINYKYKDFTEEDNEIISFSEEDFF